MKLSCREFEAMLYDYPMLDEEARRAFEAHGEECSACREEWAIARELEEVCVTASAPPPVDFTENLMAALAAEQEEEAPPPAILPWLLGVLGVELAAAIVCRQDLGRMGCLAAEIATDFCSGWILPAFRGLGAELSRLTGGLSLDMLPFRADWTFAAAGLFAALLFSVFTLYQARRDHA